MFIKLFRTNTLNLYKHQIRNCQVKSAINEQTSQDKLPDCLHNELNLDNQANQNCRDNQNDQDNQDTIQTSLDIQDDKNDKKDKKRKRKNGPVFKNFKIDQNERAINRLNRYRKSMGLDDQLDNQEALRIIEEFFNSNSPGLRYFEQTGSPVYGPNFVSPIWYRQRSYKPLQYKFIAAELFEKNIIYDFSYENFMNRNEKNSLVYQILISLGLNNRNRNPFPILLANLDKNTYTYEKLHRFYFNDRKYNSTVKVTDQSYLDVLPKEEIIYLSPHAEESLDEFNPNYHYVIGCFIDISFSKNLSFKKAQAEGVKSYKLPIDEFVAYSKIRNKLLPLPIVHQILLDKKMKADWKFALECNLGSNRIELELEEVEEFTKKYKNFKKHSY